jgi:chorismate mutase
MGTPRGVWWYSEAIEPGGATQEDTLVFTAGDASDLDIGGLATMDIGQYRLFSDWSADPAHAPANAPDLGQVRPVLDRITGELLDALATSRAARTDAGCPATLGRAVEDAERDQHLDEPHRHGLDRAVRSICG